uniref:Uncharacterized protein n=1 Tax=Gibberella zeae (strain ATCC MYA-4620 / CBS 123657 / FGSC 9075 / NRRL 31084 / PH-1) TaxID=229533 RepID=A0A098D6J8_GIBZE
MPPRSSPRSRPAPAVPTSECPSRTPARPPRPSTAGSFSALLPSSRTSRSTRRPSPCDDTPAALAAPPKASSSVSPRLDGPSSPPSSSSVSSRTLRPTLMPRASTPVPSLSSTSRSTRPPSSDEGHTVLTVVSTLTCPTPATSSSS